MEKLFSVLHFLRITDEQDRISLTNIAVAGSFIALVLRPEVAITDLAAFAMSILGYAAKRFVTGSTPEQDSAALETAIKSLETKVTALQLGQKAGKR